MEREDKDNVHLIWIKHTSSGKYERRNWASLSESQPSQLIVQEIAQLIAWVKLIGRRGAAAPETRNDTSGEVTTNNEHKYQIKPNNLINKTNIILNIFLETPEELTKNKTLKSPTHQNPHSTKNLIESKRAKEKSVNIQKINKKVENTERKNNKTATKSAERVEKETNNIKSLEKVFKETKIITRIKKSEKDKKSSKKSCKKKSIRVNIRIMKCVSKFFSTFFCLTLKIRTQTSLLCAKY